MKTQKQPTGTLGIIIAALVISNIFCYYLIFQTRRGLSYTAAMADISLDGTNRDMFITHATLAKTVELIYKDMNESTKTTYKDMNKSIVDLAQKTEDAINNSTENNTSNLMNIQDLFNDKIASIYEIVNDLRRR
ncbi:hypothetical protein ACFL1E_00285 [Candidatus Omnitrophota bacterium]